MRILDQTSLPARIQEQNLQIEVCPATELPDNYLQQLVANSRQEHIASYEDNNIRPSRFKDRDTFQKWAHDNDRILYLLVHAESKEVGGIIWFGEKKCPLEGPDFAIYTVTFSIRLFESCLGKGLSVPFTEATHTDALEQYYPGKSVWLETAHDNEVAQRSYLKVGYKQLGTHGDRIIMGYTKGQS